MRHNDAHHNNSLVQICTQLNLDRNPFIYISCVPGGTKPHCIAEVLPLLFCSADIWDENSVMASSWISSLNFRVVLWQPAGKLWEELAPTVCRLCEWGCLLMPVQPPGGKLGYSSSLQGEEFICCMGWTSLPVFVPAWLRKGEQGIKVLPYIALHVV